MRINQSFFKKIYNYICFQITVPFCIRCGSLQVQQYFFCKNCYECFLSPRLNLKRRYINVNLIDFEVEILIQWVPSESDCLSEMVYLLKKQFSYYAWDHYSAYFRILFPQKLLDVAKTVIIPVPGSQQSKTAYHTQYFSNTLANYTKLDILKCIKKIGSVADQKSLNLKDRSIGKFEFLEEFTSQIQRMERIILIDDVVTSGNTLASCIVALKPYLQIECKIEIIALFSREKI